MPNPLSSAKLTHSINLFNTSELPCQKSFIQSQWILRKMTKANGEGNQIAYLKHTFINISKKSNFFSSIVKSILDGKSHELFDTIAPAFQPPPNSSQIGNGTHRFSDLQECACYVLDRVKKSEIRAEYEKMVLHKIDILSNSLTTIPISLFAPGKLFGEFVLLVKILDLLKAKNWKGELKLFFIDVEYASSQAFFLAKALVKNSETSINYLQETKSLKIPIKLQAVKMYSNNTTSIADNGSSKAIQKLFEFLHEMAPPTIQLKNFFFENTEHYTELAKQKPHFKNVLQIGSDIGDNRLTVIDLVNQTQAIHGLGMVVLVPREVKDQNDRHVLLPNGCRSVQPMIIFKETQTAEIQYIWLNYLAKQSSFISDDF